MKPHVSVGTDDQDFMPNKRPRRQSTSQCEPVGSNPACVTACRTSSLHSTGKENQPPRKRGAERLPEHAEQQGQLIDGETLPLRQRGFNTTGASSLLVRAFFTKSRQTPTRDTTATCTSTTGGISAEPANASQQTPQSSTAIKSDPHNIASPAGPVPSPLPGNFIVLEASDSDEEASDDGDFADLQTQAVQAEQAVLAWLHGHGLASYAAAFSQAEVDMDLLPCLTDADLKQMGVTALGPRRKILAAASKLVAQTDTEEPIKHEGTSKEAVSMVRLHS